MKLIFGGDICPTEITSAGFASGDVRSVFGTVPTLTADADAFMVNLECAITAQDTPITKMGPNLRAPVETAQTLKKSGVTHIGLSNNHTFDYGTPGFRDTMRYIAEAGIPYTGVGENEQDARKPLYFTADGVRVAVLCVCEHEYSYATATKLGTWGFDPFETMEDVSIAREKADLVIVMYHGGKEQCEYPSPRLRRLCQGLVRAGADIVLCQHSHCIGVRENYRGGEILYGEGNFCFCENNENVQWMSGLLAEITGEKGSWKVNYHPVIRTETGVTLAEGSEREALLNAFRERSKLLENDGWLREWHGFCEGMRDYYTRGITGDMLSVFPDFPPERLSQFFPHFLDCEAHTDVWRELFPSWHGDGTDER